MRICSFFLEVILVNQLLNSLQLIFTGVQAAGGRKCSFLHMSDTFRRTSTCLKICEKTNYKCKICKKKTGKSREICMLVHKKTFVRKCKSCIKTEIQVKSITSLNDLKLGSKSGKFFVQACTILCMISNPNLKYNDEFDGETALSIQAIRFSHHDINGKFIREDVSLRILFGRNAKPKQIPWQVQIVNHIGETKCAGTLVTPNKIVAAAHCFPTYRQNILRPKNLTARVGSIRQDGKGKYLQERKCSYIIVHS